MSDQQDELGETAPDDEPDDHADDLTAFKRVSEAESDQRKAALEMLKFVKEGKQWPEEVRSKREREGRPCLTINRLPAFAKQVTNDARQNRPTITCHPVGDDADRDTAEILNGLIRNIEYTSNADVAYDTGLDFAVNAGIGYWTVNIDYADADSFDKDLKIERIDNPFAVYGDPDSRAADSSDWNSAFIVQKMTKDEFERKWPKAKSSNFDVDDVNREWFEEDKIQIAERWVRDKVEATLIKLSTGAIMMEEEYSKIKDLCDVQGVTVTGTRPTQVYRVRQRIISGAETLERNDWPGKYIPIVPCYGDEVNIDGKRSWQSLFHFAKDPQINYNFWRTAATELVALAPKAPFIGPVEAFNADPDKWITANTDSHAFIAYDGEVAPQRQAFAGVPAGAVQEAMNASDDLKNIMGLHDASLGAQGNETSGKAILARQREGDVATFNFIDNQSRAIRHTGRILVDLIPKVYDIARIIRVIKPDGTNYPVPVNQPVQVMPVNPQPGQPNIPQYRPVDPNQPPAPMPMPQGPGPQPVPMQGGAMPPQGIPQGSGQPPMQQQAPQSQDQQNEAMGLIKTFDLATGKYDVTCEAGPSFTTRREESAQQMMQFVQSFPASAPIIGDIIAKNLDWPGAEEIAKRLQGMLPPGAQGQNPELMQAHQAIQQLQQQLHQAQQQINDKSQDFQIRQAEVQVKMMDAQTKQAQAQHAMSPTPDLPVDKTMEWQKMQSEQQLKKYEIDQDNATKIVVAEIGANTTLQTTQSAIDQKTQDGVMDGVGQMMPHIQNLGEQIASIHQALPAIEQNATAQVAQHLGPVMDQLSHVGNAVAVIHAHVTAPKKIVRGKDGKATHIAIGDQQIPINRDANGRMEGT